MSAIQPKPDHSKPLHPYEALARYTAVKGAIDLLQPQALAPDDLEELEYLEGQLDRAQYMADMLADSLRTLWDSASSEDNDMHGALWMAHEYAAMMSDVACAHGNVRHRIALHYQAAAGGGT